VPRRGVSANASEGCRRSVLSTSSAMSPPRILRDGPPSSIAPRACAGNARGACGTRATNPHIEQHRVSRITRFLVLSDSAGSCVAPKGRGHPEPGARGPRICQNQFHTLQAWITALRSEAAPANSNTRTRLEAHLRRGSQTTPPRRPLARHRTTALRKFYFYEMTPFTSGTTSPSASASLL